MKIRIVVADDSDLMRQSFAALLSRYPDMEVVEQFSDGRALIEETQRLRPDVALVDVAMPELNGLDALTILRRTSPRTRVILVSNYIDDEYVRKAVEGGASGYITKEGAANDLVEAIRNGHRGHLYFSHELAPVVEKIQAGAASSRIIVGLSPRERQVLQLIAEGFTTSQIAERLGIEETTVKTHRDHIMEKTGRRSIAMLTRLAVSLKLVRDD